MNPKASSVDEYISWFPAEIQEKLQLIRKTIQELLPEAKEVISYHMPAFKTTEVLVYYAAMKNHIGFYPTSSGVTEFKEELKGFNCSKGAIQIPYDQELPLDLIGQIAQFRENEAAIKAYYKPKKPRKA
ncbi:DUF1801 domain-containing protein [Algoriphagus sp. CAU 1675]|uniref:iron chaperone n=1 Tax=Algoriphagus sp. CAU 1675 TaxID=3032597 RepID=UPI0023DAE0FD|nr:DUF1801 domain-containing protein [Algoriphagus sp. CAU 1675]MDF2158378.1 DUF1801 domain-containing protein [Algoriphagus sp. CAU 1675]